MIMLIKHLQRWLTTPIERSFSPQVKFWFCLSLTFAAIYGLQGLQEAFSSPYVIQDDARQHVFWMQRFVDPELFANDLIANYYQSTAPLGYKTLYRIFALAGIDPILLSKLLPIVLGLLTTGYGFALCLEILPVPATGFIATLLLNYMLWSGATLVTATSRALFWPCFLAFLYYLLRRSLISCLIAIALQGLFYPPSVLVTAGILILRLLRWQSGLPRLRLDRSNTLLCAAGLGVVFLILLLEVLGSSEFGPTITLAQAKASPEFYAGGRTSFFTDDPWQFWFNSHRSALMGWPWKPPILYAVLLLPILWRYPARFPLVREVTSGATVLIQMAVVSVGLFFTAHAVLFKLYLPSRYALGLGVAIYLSTAIVLVVILDAVLRACQQPAKITVNALGLFLVAYTLLGALYWFIFYYPGQKKLLIGWLALGVGITLIVFLLDLVEHQAKREGEPVLGRQLLALASTVVLAVALLIYPSLIGKFPNNDYVVGQVPQLYEFLAGQPKDIVIASLASEADNLPSFAKRSILVGREYALPYEVGYYKQIRQRVIDLIDAQYSTDLEQVQNFIKNYDVDFWMLEQEAFTLEYIANPSSQTSRWIRQYQPAAKNAQKKLEQGSVPALVRVMERCSVFETKSLVVLQAECIRKIS
ncbi:MAG TPA: hypothetical protein DDZ80_23830 [Cyanobacteria bacterium UBA8803]|nr:hypothetical protein [Cyanobacteria bacterium UBA9273]HBL61347.1 hypothetical protein [Cyanobacteria bacterium UBA8803]